MPFQLAKWLCEVLKPVLEQYSQYCVQEPFGLACTIRDLPSEFADSFVCSFNVSSIFTNVLRDDSFHFFILYI